MPYDATSAHSAAVPKKENKPLGAKYTRKYPAMKHLIRLKIKIRLFTTSNPFIIWCSVIVGINEPH